MSDAGSKKGRKRSLLRSPLLWIFLAAAVLAALIVPWLRVEPAAPPVVARLPAFTLVAPSGEPFGSRDLAGHVYVASFFFTRCRTICPFLMERVRQLQERLEREELDGVHLVSISVDPEHDTPERLVEYAGSHGVDPERWTLLTGDPDTVRDVIERGFMVAVGEPETDPGGFIEIAHTAKLVLVDRQGGIRGYYGIDPDGLDGVLDDSRRVLRERG